MSESFELPSADMVTVGTVGEPGQRTFYFQARAGRTRLTLKLEKLQVAGLVAALQELLSDLPPTTDDPTAPDLEEPIEPAWVTGGIGLSAYDETTTRVTILLEELVEEGAEGASARVGVTIAQMVGLAARGAELVVSGRPPCPLCGNPMDPDGHSCPKTNGHLKH